jgi:hypothetical protein
MSDSEHDRLEPPPELDRIIIGNARKAIQGTPPVPVYRAPTWALPVALAATIVISLAVVLQLGLRPKHQAAPAQVPIATEIVADAPLITDAPAATAAVPAPPTSTANSHVAAGRRATARTTATARSSPSPKASSPAKSVARLRLPAIPTDPWPPAAASNATPATDAAQQPADEKSRTRVARVEVAESRSRTDTESSAEATPSISNAEPNPPAAAPPRVAYAPARPPTEATPGVVTLEEVVVAGPAPSRHTRAHLDPVAWVTQIEKLHSAGRTAEAEREIKRFREAYPAYPLPTEAAAADSRAH